MRRTISLLLALSMLLSLTLSACGSSAVSEAAPEPSPEPVPEGIVITEVMGANNAVWQDEDGDFSDWFEIENTSDSAVSMAGWTVTDDPDAEGWTFPEYTLEPGTRILVFASGKDRSDGEFHTNFSLSDGEGLLLRDSFGQEVCSFAAQEYTQDASWVLQADGTAAESLYPTPNQPNTMEGYEAWQESLSASGPLIISEVVVDNFSEAYQQGIGYPDWIEIKNISSEPVNLADYYLSDDSENLQQWQMPEMELEPGYKMVFYCVGEEYAEESFRYTNFKLDSERDAVFLSSASGLLDRISLRDIPYEGSEGRADGQNGWFYFSEPTPGAENAQGSRRVSATPVCAEGDGVFEDVTSVTVTLTAAEGAAIYYTTDGSLPTQESTLYTGPVTVTETSAVRAVAVEPGQLQSRVLTLNYFLNEGFTLPVVSVRADDVKEFKKMYTNGQKDTEMPGTVSFYEDGGSFTIGCGLSMNGETSLKLAKKNMAMRFRGSYGSSTLKYDLFGGGVTEFTNLLLRSGQDYYYAVVRNELCQSLAQEFSDSLITQRGRYVILYLNGEYYGVYALKEKVNEQLYASIAGVSKDSVTLVEATVSTRESFYSEVYELIVNHDMSDPEWYAKACEVLDMDSMIDWIIMEGYCANNDLLSGNVRYVKSSENDGKWRLVFYDLDATLLRTFRIYYNLYDSGRMNQQVSRMCRSLKNSSEFREAFLKRFSEAITTTLSNEHVLSEFNRLVAEIEPEMERDFETFDRSMHGWNYNVNYVRSLIQDYDWAGICVNYVCRIFQVTDEEKAIYFGQS